VVAVSRAPVSLQRVIRTKFPVVQGCCFFFSSRRRHTRSVSAFLLNRLPIFPLSAADLPPSPTKSSNLSETAEVPACNVPSRSPLPALAIAPETKLGTASSGLGTLEP